MSKAPSKYTSVSIPIVLNDKIKALIKPTGFVSVSGFVTYLLRQVVSDNYQPSINRGDFFTKADEEKVKDRLRSLGYLK